MLKMLKVTKLIHLKIDFPTILDIHKEIDPDLHRAVFIQTANDVVNRSIPKVNTRLKRKWNLIMKKNDAYNYVVASAVDGSFSKRGGTLNFKSATLSRPLIEMRLEGSPINDKRFDFSFDAEINSLKNNQRKLSASIKRRDKALGKDKYATRRPRVKILKSKNAVTLNNAFYATMKSGHSGIFRRRDDGKRIIELRTITLPSMFEQLDFEALLDTHYKENVTKRYDHYLLRALKSRGL